jgi:hypothetical protein
VRRANDTNEKEEIHNWTRTSRLDEYDRERLELRESEKRWIEKRVTVSALIVHEAIRQEGEDELAHHPLALM